MNQNLTRSNLNQFNLLIMKLSYVLIAAVIVCSACSKTRKAPNGLEAEVVREGEGKFAEPGQYLVMSMLFKDTKDSVWDDTRKREIPVVIPMADTSAMKSEKGIESIFRVMKKGDSLVMKVTAKSFFENTQGRQVPANIKPEMLLTFSFGVIDITNQEGLNKLQEKIMAIQNEKNRAQSEGQLAADTTAIDGYLADKKITAMKDKSGLRYVITKASNGEKPTLSSTVIVKYKGSLMENGLIFDESQIEYPLTSLVQGWQIGFQLLSKGSKATLYVPSSLGYGLNGSPPDIPANANLVFEVELIDFK